MQYGGYSGYWRAVKALEDKYGIRIDVPMAGVLDEGQHVVTLTDVVLATTFFDLTFVDDKNSSHRQRVFRHDHEQLEALRDAGIATDRPQDSRGQRCVITLAWQRGRYRIKSLPTGMFVAEIDGVEMARSTNVTTLKTQASELGYKQSYLEVIGYEREIQHEHGNRNSREQLRSTPTGKEPTSNTPHPTERTS